VIPVPEGVYPRFGEELKERTMPHVIVKLRPGKREQQKIRLTAEMVKDATIVLDHGEESVSVALEEMEG
jgi:phenylpyruvate tautomerase PptA (4-oxalocrotonate tautomerase family)